MTIKVNYRELETYISSHYGKSICIGHVNDSTVRIGTKIAVSFFSKEVGLNLSVDRVDGKDICLRYNNGIKDALMVKGALNYLNMKKPAFREWVEERPNGSLVIHLGNIEQIRRVFDFATLQSFSFDSDGVIIQATLL